MAAGSVMPEREITRECVMCSKRFSYIKHAGQRGRFKVACSPECKVASSQRLREKRACARCGALFNPRRIRKGDGPGTALHCSQSCSARSNGDLRRIHADVPTRVRHNAMTRRARKKAATIERFTAEEIFDRDAWRCGICGKKVSKTATWPDRMMATLDHIVSLADGGAHSRANTQCAHWLCNSRKTHRSAGQMRLF